MSPLTPWVAGSELRGRSATGAPTISWRSLKGNQSQLHEAVVEIFALEQVELQP